MDSALRRESGLKAAPHKQEHKNFMKKLFILVTSALFIAGCHSRDASRGGSYYDESGNPGTTATPSPSTTQPSDNDTTKGSDGEALSDPSKNTGNDPSSTSTNSTPDNPPSQPSNP